jgi:short-subunit dehydrogenase
MSAADPAVAFRARYGPVALVAGASDGIGEWFARAIAEAGIDVILLARREAVLARLCGEIGREYGVEARPLVADLTAPDLEARVESAVQGLEVGLVVYNAGAVHGVAPFHEKSLEHALGLVDLNCRGPILLAHRLGGRMRARGRGGIVLLSSMVAFSGSAYVATYAATKAFDRVLAEGLWRELAPHGVDVLGVVAGATRTPSMLASNPGFASAPDLMEPEAVARGALAALGRGPLWIAGARNRELAKGMEPVSRVALINAMSGASAALYGLSDAPVAGADFGEIGDPPQRRR